MAEIEIIPAILTRDLADFEARIRRVEGLFDRVQIDIIDGVFVENRTLGLEALEGFETPLKIDLHLMVKEPIDWVDRALRVLADRVVGQIEMASDQEKFVQAVIDAGMKVGLALDLETPVGAIKEELFALVDQILVLSVKAGFSGQEFQPKALEKVAHLIKKRELWNGNFQIGLDGGLNETHLKEVAGSGVDFLVFGNALFGEEEMASILAKWQEKLRE